MHNRALKFHDGRPRPDHATGECPTLFAVREAIVAVRQRSLKTTAITHIVELGLRSPCSNSPSSSPSASTATVMRLPSHGSSARFVSPEGVRVSPKRVPRVSRWCEGSPGLDDIQNRGARLSLRPYRMLIPVQKSIPMETEGPGVPLECEQRCAVISHTAAHGITKNRRPFRRIEYHGGPLPNWLSRDPAQRTGTVSDSTPAV